MILLWGMRWFIDYADHRLPTTPFPSVPPCKNLQRLTIWDGTTGGKRKSTVQDVNETRTSPNLKPEVAIFEGTHCVRWFPRTLMSEESTKSWNHFLNLNANIAPHNVTPIAMSSHHFTLWFPRAPVPFTFSCRLNGAVFKRVYPIRRCLVGCWRIASRPFRCPVHKRNAMKVENAFLESQKKYGLNHFIR